MLTSVGGIILAVILLAEPGLLVAGMSTGFSQSRKNRQLHLYLVWFDRARPSRLPIWLTAALSRHLQDPWTDRRGR